MSIRGSSRAFGAKIFALLVDGPVTPRGCVDRLGLSKQGSPDQHVKAWLDALEQAGGAHISGYAPLPRSSHRFEPIYTIGPAP